MVAEQVLIDHVLFHLHLLHLNLILGIFLDLTILDLICDRYFFRLVLLSGDTLLLSFLLNSLPISLSVNPYVDLSEFLLQQLTFLSFEDLLGHSNLFYLFIQV